MKPWPQLYHLLFGLHTEAAPTADHQEVFRHRWLLARYIQAALATRGPADPFAEVETYCFFVGFPRSGHSLLGALLDAHPQIVIAHELDALRLIQAGFRRAQLFHCILANSAGFAAVERAWSGYSYAVPNQWQGRYERLTVIGDKKGGDSSEHLLHHPGLLSDLRQTVAAALRIVIHIRNPFDCIATNCRRAGLDAVDDEAVDAFFRKCRLVVDLERTLPPEELVQIRHEAFLQDPEAHLRRLVTALGVEDCSAAYLRDATSIIKTSPHQSRSKIRWAPELTRRVTEQIGEYPFLAGYTFDD